MMRTGRFIAVGLGAAVALAPTVAASAPATKVLLLKASMTPRQVVTPKDHRWRPPASVAKAKGTFTGQVSKDGRRLRWKLTYANLGAPGVVIADVHIGKFGKFGPILVRLCKSCKSGQQGIARLKAPDRGRFASGNTWVTLITYKYPNGVVRGQIHVH